MLSLRLKLIEPIKPSNLLNSLTAIAETYKVYLTYYLNTLLWPYNISWRLIRARPVVAA